jgi:hypothetical protein
MIVAMVLVCAVACTHQPQVTGRPDAGHKAPTTSPTPAAQSGTITFTGRDGWETWDRAAVQAGAPAVAWASTIPFDPADLTEDAPAIPIATIAELGGDEARDFDHIVVTALAVLSEYDPGKGSAGPTDLRHAAVRMPDPEEPPGDYAVLEIPAPPILVRAYFSVPLHDTGVNGLPDNMVDRAQAELDTLQIEPGLSAEMTAVRELAKAFLAARVDGRGAEAFLARGAVRDFPYDGRAGLYDSVHGEGWGGYGRSTITSISASSDGSFEVATVLWPDRGGPQVSEALLIGPGTSPLGADVPLLVLGSHREPRPIRVVEEGGERLPREGLVVARGRGIRLLSTDGATIGSLGNVRLYYERAVPGPVVVRRGATFYVLRVRRGVFRPLADRDEAFDLSPQFGSNVDLRRPDGTVPQAGRWVYALPGPAGVVLAQWSGECEVQNALLVTKAGVIEPVTGEADITEAPESVALGWDDAGRALVQVHEGVCGSPVDRPGIYAFDEAGTGGRIVAGVPDAVRMWGPEA